MKTVEMDLSRPMELTAEQLRELEEADARPVCPDDDCPALTDEQLKILSLVLSHPGTRGGSRRATYFQGMETERVNSLRNLMSSMRLTLRQAMDALNIPEAEYDKYAAVFPAKPETGTRGRRKSYVSSIPLKQAVRTDAAAE
ncbi:MAG: hypothetical protein IJS96_02990 [Schwartzia sp.]|nr:hypothetical protein [Schwartzia sp. (in: firmicutes)]